MKRINLIFLSVLALWQMPVEAQPEIKTVSGVYVGGHIRRERPKTITTLRESGFTYVLLFNVHVDPDGTLKTDGEVICKDGEYVFAKPQPNYQMDIRNLKTPPTSIQRIDIVIGGWGNNSYDNIKNLINTKGTGANTMLYKNFKALKEAVPEIDGVNNDDEQCYDLETGAKFHIMMYNLGYKTTLAPYTNKSYWQNLCTKIRASKPDAVDRVMVQCYDGGAGNVNRVGTWTFNGVNERHAGLLNYSNDWSVDKNMAQFQKWKDDGVATGGFVWVYNDETWDLNAWASAMNRTFTARPVSEEETGAIAYSNTNFKGYAVRLPEGSHSMADLAVLGLKAQDMESMQITEGYTVRLHKTTDCSGAYWPVKRDAKSFTATWSNQVRSIEVEKLEPDGITDAQASQPRISVTDGSITVSDGRSLILRITDPAGSQVMLTHLTEDVQSFSLAPLPHGIYIVCVGEKSIKISI